MIVCCMASSIAQYTIIVYACVYRYTHVYLYTSASIQKYVEFLMHGFREVLYENSTLLPG